MQDFSFALKHYETFLKAEKERTSLGKRPGSNADHRDPRKSGSSHEHASKHARSENSADHRRDSSSRTAHGNERSKTNKPVMNRPIIIVPNTLTGIIHLYSNMSRNVLYCSFHFY